MGSQPTEWPGIWVSHYVLAALLQTEAVTEKGRFHQTEAIRLGREMTERRPDWPVAWHLRALSGFMAAGVSMNHQVREPRLPYLQDALMSLDRMASLGSDASSALEMRYLLLMFLRLEYLVQGNEAKSQELSKQVVTVDAELQRRGIPTSTSENDALPYRIKKQEAELLCRSRLWRSCPKRFWWWSAIREAGGKSKAGAFTPCWLMPQRRQSRCSGPCTIGAKR
jgi:hypothetical protein